MRDFTDAELRDGFAVRYSAEKGRHLIAARPFCPGAVILQQEPYAAVLTDGRTPGYCDYCFRACERPLRCSRSKLARYCCKEHQRLAWASGYKVECEALVRCAPRVPPPTVRLAARILWRRARARQQQPSPLATQQQQQQQPAQHRGPAGWEQGPPSGPHLQTIALSNQHQHVYRQSPLDSDAEELWRLEHHWEQLDDRRKSLYAQMAVVTWQYMYGTPDGPCTADLDDGTVATGPGGGAQAGSVSRDGGSAGAASAAAAAAAPVGWPGFRAVAQLLSRLASNCHTVCDGDLRPLGVALYPSGALVNHSCRPNAVQTFRGSSLQLRALASVSPGSEITIAYVELAATRQERRESLVDSYFFDINTALSLPPPPVGPVSGDPAPFVSATGMEPGGGEGAQDVQAMEVDSEGRSQRAADRAGDDRACGSAVAIGVRACVTGNGSRSGSASGSGSGSSSRALDCRTRGSDDAGSRAVIGQATPALRPPPILSMEVAANAQLYVYSTVSEQPPWPTDPWDGELTQVSLAMHAEVNPGSNIRSKADAIRHVADRTAVPLAGGLLARLAPRRPNEPEEEEEGGVNGVGEEEGCDDMQYVRGGQIGVGSHITRAETSGGDDLCGPADTDMPDAGGPGLRGPCGSTGTAPTTAGRTDTATAVAAPLRKRPPPALQLPASVGHGHGRGGSSVVRWPRIELVAWGPWVSELVRAAEAAAKAQTASAADGSGSGNIGSGGSGAGSSVAGLAGAAAAPPPHSAVAALLRRCVHALHLSHQAEAASGWGDYREAVDLLERALQLLDGRTTHPPLPPGHHYLRYPRHHLDDSERGQRQLDQRPQPHSADGHGIGDLGPNGELVLGPNHILRLRLHAQLLKVAVDLASGGDSHEHGPRDDSLGGMRGAWEVALRSARALEGPYRLVYTQAALPNLTLHYATLAKLEMLLGRPRRAMRAADIALKGLRLTHVGGWDREAEGVVGQVVRVGREAEAELRMRGQAGQAFDDEEAEEGGSEGGRGGGVARTQ